MADPTATLSLPLLAIPGGVVVPGMVVTVALESSEAAAALDAAEAGDGRLVVVPRLDHGYAAVGTIATVEQTDRLRNGRRGVLLRGTGRARITSGTTGTGSATWVVVDPTDDVVDDAEAVARMAVEYRAIVEALLTRRGVPQLAHALGDIEDPGQLADTAVYAPDLDVAQKVQLLEALVVDRRLEVALSWMRAALAELEVRERIASEVTDSLEQRQRDAILREQLQAIRKELGEGGEDDIAGLRARIADVALPVSVRAAVDKELGRLGRTSEQSPEHAWIRTWIDRVLEVPWGVRTDDDLDLVRARSVLDADHTGLDEVKERIVELLAVRKLRVDRGLASGRAEGPVRRGDGAILVLVGPPGVGKTSLGESVARALGRRFVRVALGGVRDEAEIRGHRRTYVGAQPGRLVRAITEAGSLNPVILLDEIDKVGADWRGDPSSALLEVLDPAQNHTFRDSYLEVDLDLSDVLFLATANVLDTIPGPLVDRMELVQLDGYTDPEKVVIAREHLLPRQIDRAGLRQDELDVGDEALRRIAEGWTREAGVRQLERQLGKVVRKAATRVAGGEPTPVVVDDPTPFLGRQRVFPEVAERTTEAGVATGLAVTGAGGDVLFVEVTAMDGEPALQLTGQLGDVMKESASIALSYVRAHAAELGIPAEALQRRFHVHVPAGAVPKDGPSAGVTIATALVSLLTGRRVRSGVGMTGEVTLQGRVLPIGGVKQKVLAAHRAGLDTVLLPARNEADLEDVPEAVLADVTVHPLGDVRAVLDLALEPLGGALDTAAA